jgi:hypothetical protein
MNVFQGSDLPALDYFVGFRPFASVFAFCQRNDTRSVTRRERLPSSLVGLTPEDLLCALVNHMTDFDS